MTRTVERLPVVPDGVRFHRYTVRRNGPFVSAAAAAALGLVATILLVGSESTWRGVLGFVIAVMALPTMSIVGIPVMGGTTRWLLAIGTSAAVWLAIGALAARRSTRRVATSWPEWRREWLRLVVGIWAGALVGIGVAATFLSVNL